MLYFNMPVKNKKRIWRDPYPNHQQEEPEVTYSTGVIQGSLDFHQDNLVMKPHLIATELCSI